jgi:thermitase
MWVPAVLPIRGLGLVKVSEKFAGALALVCAVSVGAFVFRPAAEGTIPPAESVPTQAPAPREKPSFATSLGQRFAPQRVLVVPQPGVAPEELAQLNERVGGRVDRVVPGSRIRQVRLPPSVSVAEAVRRYEASPLVRFAEPDFMVRPSQSTVGPNDPDYPRLWGLRNTGQTGGVDNADVDAPEAWRVTTGTTGPPVAVIDTGMDVTHPDLKANLWTNPGEVAGNGVDDDRNGYVDDIHGWDFYHGDNTVFDGAEDDHGTHVAGTVAATGGNGIGVTGVNWRARLMSVKFLGPDGGYTSDAIAALDYAVNNGARISNNSWGGGGDSQALQEAITRAAEANHLFIAAAGNGAADGVGDNNDVTPHYPSSYPQDNIVSVAASTDADKLASFSNYGAASVDLAAPGVNIVSTLTRGAYGSYNGTSMATPHVSGAAVLMLAAEPSLSATQVKARLLESVDPVAALRATVTGGRLDVGRALGGAAASAAEVVLSAGPSTVNFGGSTALSGVLSAGGKALTGQEVILEGRPVGSSRWATLSNGTRTTDAEGGFTLSGVRPSQHTDYRARYAGTDGMAGAGTSQVRRVSVRVTVSLALDTRDLQRGRSRVLSGVARPLHGGTVQLVISRNGTVIARRNLDLVDSRYRFTYKPAQTGRYSFVVRRFADTDHLANRSPLKAFRVVR